MKLRVKYHRVYIFYKPEVCERWNEAARLAELNLGWLTFYPSKFSEQFLKDLANMTSLGNIQWKFKKTGEISDLANLKNKVLNALGSFDNTTNKWVAGDALNGLFNDTKAVNNIKASFGGDIETADLLINELTGSSFDSIFEIIN